METNNDDTCNGWTNYETWKVATILSNTEQYYNDAHRMSAVALALYCREMGFDVENVNFEEIAECI